jgi:hypothetical protein
LFTRRPRIEQNLNAPGLAFLCVAALGFLMTKVITEPPHESAVETVRRADHLLNLEDASAETGAVKSDEIKTGPAPPLLTAPVIPLSSAVASGAMSSSSELPADAALHFEELAARIIAILAHITAVAGLIVLGRTHFSDPQLGLAMATLYLLLPCTAFDVGKVTHVLPAALIIWAFVSYRHPMVAGSLMGLACGTLFFPIFLLPLWAAFYGRRGAVRFGMALGLVAAVLLGSLVLTSADTHSFTRQILGSIDWRALQFRAGDEIGFWGVGDEGLYDPNYRFPVFVAFMVMLLVLTLWPARKNLEHLIAHSTAIVIGTQFWYPIQGGVYLLWYVPLLLMVVFRPRLAHLRPPGTETSGESSGKPAEQNGPALAISGTSGPDFLR